MAKRKAGKRTASARSSRKRTPPRRSAERPTTKRPTARKTKGQRKPAATSRIRNAPTPRKAVKARTTAAAPVKVARLDRVRRTLDDTVQTPPSSLNMDRRGSAARTGRAEMAESLLEHRGMSPDITGGDADVDIQDAYFTGDETPGGDNPTPDQDVVDDIGKALGVQYDDNEELKASDKIGERDKHRWEMDPASSEDYKERT